MLFERFTDDDLSHYSYALGCPAVGELAIVDPRRDVDVYQRFAEEQGLEITRVLETHIHADFASGARELAHRTGAELLVSGHDEGEDFEVAFPHTDLMDGQEVSFGSVRIRALHTPGHTPEHLCYLDQRFQISTTVAPAMHLTCRRSASSTMAPHCLRQRALAGERLTSARCRRTSETLV